ncbi:MAG: NHLP bacteriocin export ABC transporter permease/ATPase subunit [Myxococcota bacterium]|nr:NHLP bacteriocin export ABC transporter permease/ATPase subunit [Myxococcota bacterium]
MTKPLTLTMPSALSPVGEGTYRLQPTELLRLDDPNLCMLVRKGGLRVLGCQIQDGEPVGERRYLFDVPPGQAVFGCLTAPEDGLSLMALTDGPTLLQELSMQGLAGLLELSGLARELVEGWARRVGQALLGERCPPPGLLRPEEPGELELVRDELLTPPGQQLLWLSVRTGRVTFLGDPELPLAPEHGHALLGGGCWVQAGSATVELDSWSDASPPPGLPLAEALDNLHRLLRANLRRRRQRDAVARAAQRVRSQQRERAEAREALDDLTAVLDPQPRPTRRDSPLLTALGVVGEAQGIPIHAPARSEDLRRAKDPLEAVARASKCRYRKVTLPPGWEGSDSGPLLGFWLRQGRDSLPVALLPGNLGYRLVDPERLQPRPLTPELLGQLAPEAYQLFRPLPEDLRGLPALLGHLVRGRLGDLAFVLGLGTLATLLGIVAPRATATLIDAAIPQADASLLVQLALILTGATLGQALFAWIQAMTSVRLSSATQLVAQTGLWDRLLRLRPSFFRGYSAGDLTSRVNAIGEVAQQLNAAALRPLLSGTLGCLNLLLLLYYSPTLALFALAVGGLVLGVTSVSTLAIRKRSLVYQELAGAFNGLVVQLIGGVGRLRVCGAERRAFFQWARRYAGQQAVARSIQRIDHAVSLFHTVLPALCSAALFYFGAGLVLGDGGAPGSTGGAVSLGGYLACSAAFFLFLQGFTDLSQTAVGLLRTAAKAERIWPILEAPPEVRLGAADPGRLAGRVAFEGVSFRYRADGPPVLDRLSFPVQPGQFVAFVGPSGSGKSTVLRLLLGFEQPAEGRVLYDGQDLDGLDIVALRRQIGTVLQHGRLNAGSLFDNIALAGQITHAEAWEALADAGLKEDVEAMPMGLHTMVSEGGANLSGGQRQRLLIARALVLRPRIVFFDEATSALDNRTQAVVSEALQRRKVTRVVVAHRLSTIRQADCIFVLVQGRIVQQGTYAELVAQDGVFQQLVARQLQ